MGKKKPLYTFDDQDRLVEINPKKRIIVKGQTLDPTVASELGSTYQIVRHILMNFLDTRNSDRALIARVEFYCKNAGIPVPQYETITRSRRKIQNQEGLFQADPDVRKRRMQRSKQYREAFSQGADNS